MINGNSTIGDLLRNPQQMKQVTVELQNGEVLEIVKGKLQFHLLDGTPYNPKVIGSEKHKLAYAFRRTKHIDEVPAGDIDIGVLKAGNHLLYINLGGFLHTPGSRIKEVRYDN